AANIAFRRDRCWRPEWPPATPNRKLIDHGLGLLGTLHPLPHRDIAVDGGRAVCRPCRLSGAADRAAAAGRLPDHSGVSEPAGCEPGNHGVLGRAAARAAVRADPGRRPAYLDK